MVETIDDWVLPFPVLELVSLEVTSHEESPSLTFGKHESRAAKLIGSYMEVDSVLVAGFDIELFEEPQEYVTTSSVRFRSGPSTNYPYYLLY